MQIHKDCSFVIALSAIEGLGPVRLVALIREFGSAEAVFKASMKSLSSIAYLSEDVVLRIVKNQTIHFYKKILDEVIEKKCWILHFLDESYPRRLLATSAFPPLLFGCGDKSAIEANSMLAIVGSRRMTAYGARVIKKWLPNLPAQDVNIVSGMAYGVDACALTAALDAKMKVVGVQADGVLKSSPRGNQKLYERILSEGGCIVSEFWRLEAMDRFAFPRRNRIISGLCDTVWIVEAAKKSGSLVTSAYAVEQNRNVVALPGNVDVETSRGCLELISQGAKPTLEWQHLVDDLPCSRKLPTYKIVPQQYNPPMQNEVLFSSNIEKCIYDNCQANPCSLDELIDVCEQPASQVMVHVTKMQLAGLLTQNSGGKFAVGC